MRLSQEDSPFSKLAAPAPAASSLLQGFQNPPRSTAILVSPNPSRAEGKDSAGNHSYSQVTKKSKTTQAVCVFPLGFLCSNLWSQDNCKHCLLSCLHNGHLTTEGTKVRKHGGHGAGSTPLEEVSCAWPGPTLLTQAHRDVLDSELGLLSAWE